MKKIIIAIDGPAGSGKSSTAQLVAKELDYLYIDTGAMYRAVTYLAMNNGLMEDELALIALLQSKTISLSFQLGQTSVFINGEDVSEIVRSKEINENVSYISKIASVREHLIAQQRKMGAEGGVVMEGRDIGTVVFPNADIKIFMDAVLDTRAERRQLEYQSKGKQASLTEVKENLSKRDIIDSSRQTGPLMKAEDAVEIDTTNLTLAEQVAIIVDMAKQRINKSKDRSTT